MQGGNEIIMVEQDHYRPAHVTHSSGHQERFTPGQIASFDASQSVDQVATQCDDGCLGAAGDTQLGKHITNVEFYS